MADQRYRESHLAGAFSAWHRPEANIDSCASTVDATLHETLHVEHNMSRYPEQTSYTEISYC